MSTLDLLRELPLASALIWFGLVIFQIYRDRRHTWTEVFFLFACFFAGLYAFSDWLLFQVPSTPAGAHDADALLAARISMTSVTLTELFFLLFTLVYVGRMRAGYWVLVGVSGLTVGMAWTVLTEGVITPPEGELYVPLFNPNALLVYLLYVLFFNGLGIWNLYKLYAIVRNQSRRLARRAGGLVVTFTAVLILGLGTNGYLGLVRNTQIPPPFSTLLALLGAMAMYTLYPIGRERISEAIRKFRARRYEIETVFLTYQDGTLIASRSNAREAGIDQDLFSATLDVIQNFMRTSFPILKGTSLRTIEHGDHRILIERGRQSYLTVVLTGEENDLLRRQMRNVLLDFEDRNAVVLKRWRGIPSDAVGVDALDQLFEPAQFF